jgi:tetratricopeptide (TPR) repeat protein
MAAKMASAAVSESGDCFAALGRLDEAVAAYEESIARSEALGDKRWVAVSKDRLGTILMLQDQYTQALEIYDEARSIFESLGEPETVATVLHQIGVLHRMAGAFKQAEYAYRQSLAINVQQRHLAGEAASIGELGVLYSLWKRLEEAVKCFRQAADIYVRLEDQNHEGAVRGNLASTLIRMQQYDEARHELLRAIECNEPYGHAAEPWKTWDILRDLEQACGNSGAAAQARQRAVESYLAYRRAGGQSMTGSAEVCAMAAEAMAKGDIAELEQQLTLLSGADVPPSAKALISKLQAILHGDRNPALADDPDLDYSNAVELQLLLEALESI